MKLTHTHTQRKKWRLGSKKNTLENFEPGYIIGLAKKKNFFGSRTLCIEILDIFFLFDIYVENSSSSSSTIIYTYTHTHRYKHP